MMRGCLVEEFVFYECFLQAEERFVVRNDRRIEKSNGNIFPLAEITNVFHTYCESPKPEGNKTSLKASVPPIGWRTLTASERL